MFQPFSKPTCHNSTEDYNVLTPFSLYWSLFNLPNNVCLIWKVCALLDYAYSFDIQERRIF